ncbi:methylmalonyl-CoA mutase family protein [Streptomyces sp. KL116D]|uniref:methylmalonyl-CoA mutase family protein n=1 Tax=Streptomyces sp. KL116D TaxID=3045152 RepID=UPI003555D833
MEETGVANVADPLGGSWYVEQLTDRIEADAEDLRPDQRERGLRARGRAKHPIGPITSGILRAASRTAGSPGRSRESAFQHQQSLEKGDQSGSSGSTSTTGPSPATWRSCGSATRSSGRQVRVLEVTGRGPGRREGAGALDAMVGAARDGSNMIGPMLDAVRAEGDARRDLWCAA